MSHVRMHALTDIGVQRRHNEDAVGIMPEYGIAVLADGMGGYKAGEVASTMAVQQISEMIRSGLKTVECTRINNETGFTEASLLVRKAILEANTAIFSTSQSRSECAGMGTTVLVALLYETQLTAAHLGDSRMYRLRDKLLSQITEDHSVVYEQVRCGLLSESEARNSKHKNLVTRALGVDAEVVPDIVEEFVQPGDIYLLCSDGLTDVVSNAWIQDILEHYGHDLSEASLRLIDQANAAGGPDNISVIIIQITQFPHKKGLISRIFGHKTN